MEIQNVAINGPKKDLNIKLSNFFNLRSYTRF